MNATPDGPPSNLDAVLTAIGRASTPPVPESPFGISRGRLMHLPWTHADVRAIVVGSASLLARVRSAVPAAAGIPGVLPEQVDLPGIEALIISWDAFDAGPWLGANSHAARGLTEEIFEACRRLRASGRLVLGLPERPLRSTGDARLLSTCTADLTDLDPVDLEEGATQSPLWTALLPTLKPTVNAAEDRS